MTTDPIGMISTFLTYAGREIAAQQFAAQFNIAPFVKADWLVPVKVPTTVLCEACDEAHHVEVGLVDGKFEGFCIHTGEAFPVGAGNEMFYVDGEAVARALAHGLQLDGNVRMVRGFEALWTLGGRRFGASRVAFFFTPNLARLDLATSIMEAATNQSAAMPAGLIVASDRLDHIALLARRLKVLRLRDVAEIGANGAFVIDEPQLVRMVLPGCPKPPGRRPDQRDRILPILDQLVADGNETHSISLANETISNESCSAVSRAFVERFPDDPPPQRSTIRQAIKAWKALQR